MKKTMYLLAGVLAVSLLGACAPVQKEASAGEEGQVVFACMDSTTMERGGVKLTWIKDNAKERLMPLSLFGDVPKALVDSLGIADGIPSSISCFLMETDGKYILFDTGNGASDSRLMDGLVSVGVSPSDIDYLYLTHFHGDHIGGMMKGDSVAFPQAEVYAARQEYEGWMQMPDEQKAQVARTMEAYKDRLHLFEYGDTLPARVVALNAEGHTPGHTAYQTGGFLIAGDLMHGAALQLVRPDICASYDMDPQKAVHSRKYYLEYVCEHHLLLAGMHQPAKGLK